MDTKKVFLTFKLQSGSYAIDVDNVISIERVTEFTKVPHAPYYVEGIINLRGNILPIIDLNCKISNCKTKYQHDTRILVIEIKGENFGFIVDKAEQVLEVDQQDVQASDQLFDDQKNIRGIIKQDNQLFQIFDEKALIDDNTYKKSEEV